MSEIIIRQVPLHRVYAGFTLTKILAHETQQPGTGYGAQYAGGTLGEATIFIYDHGTANVPDGPNSEMIVKEFQRAAANVVAAYPEAQLLTKAKVATTSREEAFSGAEFLIGEGNEQRHSFLLVTGVRGSFLKIRLTLSPDVGSYGPMLDFTEAVAAGIWTH